MIQGLIVKFLFKKIMSAIEKADNKRIAKSHAEFQVQLDELVDYNDRLDNLEKIVKRLSEKLGI